MSTATIVASAVGGSVSAHMALAHSIESSRKKRENNNFRNPVSWIEYEALKHEIDGFNTIEEKLNHLRKYKCFVPVGDGINTEQFNLALDTLISNLEFEREMEHMEEDTDKLSGIMF